jgi:MFS family permease
MSDSSERTTVLNPTVMRLGLVSLLADISSEMLYPITPIFLTAVLGASMSSLGLIEGTAEALASLLKTYAGSWSDRWGRRKPFIVFGYLLTALGKPLIGVAGSWPEVLLARGLDRTGKGLRGAPRDALIADSVDPRLWGAAFGWHRAMDTLGAAIGPLLAIVYLRHFSELRGIFFWAFVPGLLAVLVATKVRDVRPAKISQRVKASWRWAELSANFRTYLLAWTIFSLVNSSDVFLLMKAKASGLSLETTILIYCFYNLVYAAASPGLGHLSDKMGRKPILMIGLLVFALVYAGFAFASAPWIYWILFAVYGIYMAATDGVGKALAVDLIDPQFKATGIGLLSAVSGIATLFASLVAGLLWDHYGAASTFAYGAVGAVLALSILAFLSLPSSGSVSRS